MRLHVYHTLRYSLITVVVSSLILWFGCHKAEPQRCRQALLTSSSGFQASVKSPLVSISRERCEGFKCPCCGWCGDSVDDLADFRGRKAACPVCSSVERHMASCKGVAYLVSNVPPNTRVLHFGPQPQMFRQLQATENIIQIPVDKFALGYSYKDTFSADITDLLFPDEFVDGIICLHVLEHISKLQVAIRHVARVMKKTAWAVIEAPCRTDRGETKDCRGLSSNAERLKCASQYDHVWRFDCDDLKLRLQKGGLECNHSSAFMPHSSIQFLCRKISM